MSQSFYLCVYVPEFSSQSLLRLRPELSDAPVVVLGGEPPFEQVCSLNVQAVRLGILHGMTRAELDSFCGVSILRRSLAEELAARTALLQAAGMFTPRVEVQPTAAAPFVMVMDMAGTGRIFGTPRQAVERVAQSIRALRLHACFAGSASLQTAVCVAPAARKAPTIVPAGEEQACLAKLPLAALNPTPHQADTFTLWGLHTLGELASIPEVELVARMGQAGKRLWLLARGKHPHFMVPQEPVLALEEFFELDSPLEILDSLLFLLGPMLDQLLARAQDHAYGLASVTVKLGLDGGGEHERTIRPALPVVERDVLLKLLHLDLQAHPPHAGVLSVFLHAEPGDRCKVQLGLFAPQLPESVRLDVTLARIAALVGEQRVGRARLMDTHRPDSFTMDRFTVPGTLHEPKTKPSATAALRRCRPPVSVIVRQEGQQLTAFALRGRSYVVHDVYGPWRRSGNWWSGDVWSCEEWDVRASASTEDTLLCILSCDLLRRQWHMEALYD